MADLIRFAFRDAWIVVWQHITGTYKRGTGNMALMGDLLLLTISWGMVVILMLLILLIISIAM